MKVWQQGLDIFPANIGASNNDLGPRTPTERKRLGWKTVNMRCDGVGFTVDSRGNCAERPNALHSAVGMLHVKPTEDVPTTSSTPESRTPEERSDGNHPLLPSHYDQHWKLRDTITTLPEEMAIGVEYRDLYGRWVTMRGRLRNMFHSWQHNCVGGKEWRPRPSRVGLCEDRGGSEGTGAVGMNRKTVVEKMAR
ncbi:hypothetical protein GQ43DRAFT_434378 [Delitschia confertaspora ATCC 74209]|uniref:Uncharacterized protein n=1 Tax=Delitschia confertaspora ATCC 74209 TaxID=1513339 RepID=A0A9P4JF70_9PLEO|nr:hypothetical protein GQ43DRAFT_434378 [Delitschia confertaspora ATCC 74209]